MELFNHSKQGLESATKEKCPRCNGHGSISSDEGEQCHLCRGRGYLWISKTGWTRPLYGRIIKSEQLW